MCNWITLLYTRNEHNIVNQLYSNESFFKKICISNVKKKNTPPACDGEQGRGKPSPSARGIQEQEGGGGLKNG